VLDLFEEVTGARFHYNTHTLGGNRHDIPAGWSTKVHAAMDIISPRLDEYDSMTLDNRIFVDRTLGVGTLDAELALELGISGPILRACGVDHDLRRDSPFHAYDEVGVRVVTAQGGDCLARARVRLGEMRESVRLVRELVDAIPEGPINGYRPVKLPVQTKIPPGQTYVAIETPRGELGTYLISDGTQFPYRLKIRPPSLHALSALPYIVPGGTVSDAVAILGSMDPIMGEVDR
jgi:NADH-quinone oxidoreductase subunit D